MQAAAQLGVAGCSCGAAACSPACCRLRRAPEDLLPTTYYYMQHRQTSSLLLTTYHLLLSTYYLLLTTDDLPVDVLLPLPLQLRRSLVGWRAPLLARAHLLPRRHTLRRALLRRALLRRAHGLGGPRAHGLTV